MISEELEKIAEQAGFRRVAMESSIQTVFTRGESTLIVRGNGKWVRYSSVSGGKHPDQKGEDFKSLLLFLMSEYLLAQTETP